MIDHSQSTQKSACPPEISTEHSAKYHTEQHAEDLLLNLARPIAECPISELHGPYKRLVLWVQGCSVNCTENCINPAALTDVIRYPIKVSEAVKQIKQRIAGRDDVEGLTILGGEPSDQAGPLSALLKEIKQENLGVMLYSGHTLTKLKRLAQDHPEIDHLLAQVDLLIDGPFIDKLYDISLLWRGSSNQGIHGLSSRYEAEIIEHEPVIRGVDILLSPEGRLHLSGMHNPQLTQDFEQVLHRIANLRHA